MFRFRFVTFSEFGQTVPWVWSYKLVKTAFLLGLCLLPACMQNVNGRIEQSNETFSGTAVIEISEKKGTIEVDSSKGTSCQGQFVYLTASSATGTIRCQDGRFGPVEISRDLSGAYGYCNLSGEKFLFTIGR